MGKFVHPDIPACPACEMADEWYQLVGADLGWLPVGKAVPVNEMTIDEVVQAVGDDPVSAAASLAEERAGRDRAALVDQLAVTATHPQEVS